MGGRAVGGGSHPLSAPVLEMQNWPRQVGSGWPETLLGLPLRSPGAKGVSELLPPTQGGSPHSPAHPQVLEDHLELIEFCSMAFLCDCSPGVRPPRTAANGVCCPQPPRSPLSES